MSPALRRRLRLLGRGSDPVEWKETSGKTMADITLRGQERYQHIKLKTTSLITTSHDANWIQLMGHNSQDKCVFKRGQSSCYWSRQQKLEQFPFTHKTVTQALDLVYFSFTGMEVRWMLEATNSWASSYFHLKVMLVFKYCLLSLYLSHTTRTHTQTPHISKDKSLYCTINMHCKYMYILHYEYALQH